MDELEKYVEQVLSEIRFEENLQWSLSEIRMLVENYRRWGKGEAEIKQALRMRLFVEAGFLAEQADKSGLDLSESIQRLRNDGK